jgi:hypothetical protein
MTLTLQTAEKPITEHPHFNVQRVDWGVRPQYELTNEDGETEIVPEDRTNYRPDMDGLSMSDMWNDEKQDWNEGFTPPGMAGIKSFLSPQLINN